MIKADTMKSMLQRLDGNLLSKDDFICEQNGKLAERVKMIQSNKVELQRLEKKTKMQEQKVKAEVTHVSFRLVVWRCVVLHSNCPTIVSD